MWLDIIFCIICIHESCTKSSQNLLQKSGNLWRNPAFVVSSIHSMKTEPSLVQFLYSMTKELDVRPRLLHFLSAWNKSRQMCSVTFWSEKNIITFEYFAFVFLYTWYIDLIWILSMIVQCVWSSHSSGELVEDENSNHSAGKVVLND